MEFGDNAARGQFSSVAGNGFVIDGRCGSHFFLQFSSIGQHRIQPLTTRVSARPFVKSREPKNTQKPAKNIKPDTMEKPIDFLKLPMGGTVLNRLVQDEFKKPGYNGIQNTKAVVMRIPQMIGSGTVCPILTARCDDDVLESR